jgi:small subunit ribosomal protein S18
MIRKTTRRPTRRIPMGETKHLVFDYKDVKTLERFMTEQGYIVSRAKTGLTQKQQRRLGTAIKRARHLALLPFTQTL